VLDGAPLLRVQLVQIGSECHERTGVGGLRRVNHDSGFVRNCRPHGDQPDPDASNHSAAPRQTVIESAPSSSWLTIQRPAGWEPCVASPTRMTASKLFSPYRIGSLELGNRIIIAPMCQYSAENGCMTDWHLIHLGQLACSGAACLTIEATAILPEGRITYAD